MSAFTLRLGRAYDSAEVRLCLPASPGKIREAMSSLDEYSEDVNKPVEIREIECGLVGIKQYLLTADLQVDGELDKLNALAEKIEGMDGRQKDLLWGALDSESINSLDDVLHVADHLDQYELLGDVRNDRDLGAHLVESGWKDFPEHVRPYLDYAAIGLEYRSEHGGSFSGGGYVRKRDMDQQMEAGQKDPVLTVRLYAPGTKLTYSLSLPASDTMLEQAMRILSISELAEADIHDIEDHIGLMDCAKYVECPNVETLNELARFVSEHFTTDQDWTKFEAVCEAARVGTWQELLDIAEDLDNYQFYNTHDPEVFGELFADELLESGKDITMEMEDFITYDYRGFGLQRIKEDGVRETDHGYVRRLSVPFPSLDFEQTMGQF